LASKLSAAFIYIRIHLPLVVSPPTNSSKKTYYSTPRFTPVLFRIQEMLKAQHLA
jgi:hypothetical protein